MGFGRAVQREHGEIARIGIEERAVQILKQHQEFTDEDTILERCHGV